VLIDGRGFVCDCEWDSDEDVECAGVSGCLPAGALAVSCNRGLDAEEVIIELGVNGRVHKAPECAERGEVARLKPSMGVPLREEGPGSARSARTTRVQICFQTSSDMRGPGSSSELSSPGPRAGAEEETR
jgi:hypothetical protein